MLGQYDFLNIAPYRIAVIGTGISGLSAAWMLSRQHQVTVYEADSRIGGHCNTLDIEAAGRRVAVDTGFIVYNQPCYPNLTALFAELGVETTPTDMSFAVSLDQGQFEYCGNDALTLIAQPSNLLRRRFWSMLYDLVRFYRQAARDLPTLGDESLDEYLDRGRYGASFRDNHLYPMAAAIWSTPTAEVGRYPAAAFIRFFDNHGLLRLAGRPRWRTVVGGSREYVRRLAEPLAGHILASTPVVSVVRKPDGVEVIDGRGGKRRFDHVVIATHADQALAMLERPSAEERRLLGAFRYSVNDAVLHSDAGLMPRRRRAWASWNYLADTIEGQRRLSVSYWMNSLQPLGDAPELFVTLNPLREPDPKSVHARIAYEHPIFDVETAKAQRELWSLQGVDRTWFCGAHFGAGFHEDGLQAGLAVAEDLGGIGRPWSVANENGRIVRRPMPAAEGYSEAAE